MQKETNITEKYNVLRENFYFTDKRRIETFAKDERCRELPVSFWYPDKYTEEKKCPLVIFSHGSIGVKESNETLYRFLAENGYVVCAIDHTYHSFSTRLSNGQKIPVSGTFMKEISIDNPNKYPKKSLVHFKKWMKLRIEDINFVLDFIIERANQNTENLSVYEMIDVTRIGALGHSMGGSAALGIGRERKDVSAVISLEAPFLCDINGVDEKGNFLFNETEYPIPVLNIYSDSSWKHLREWKQYRKNAELLDIQSEKVENSYISGIGHFSLTDLSLTAPLLTMILDGKISKQKAEKILKKINIICLNFFNKHLKNEKCC